MSVLSLVALFLLSFPLLARESLMATITSDIDRNTTFFHMETDDAHSIHSIRIKSVTPHGQVFEDFSYTTEQVLDGEVILHERNGYKAVKLRVDKKFSPSQGGIVIIDYLFSGVTGSRLNLELFLRKEENSFRLLSKPDLRPINHFHFLANRHPILGIIGVRKVELSSKSQNLW
jgi:hypothetical protein